jgi:hypothetical protein
MDDITVDGDKFDAVLRRLINSKPISKAEISAKIKTEREAKRVQKMEKRPNTTTTRSSS